MFTAQHSESSSKHRAVLLKTYNNKGWSGRPYFWPNSKLQQYWPIYHPRPVLERNAQKFNKPTTRLASKESNPIPRKPAALPPTKPAEGINNRDFKFHFMSPGCTKKAFKSVMEEACWEKWKMRTRNGQPVRDLLVYVLDTQVIEKSTKIPMAGNKAASNNQNKLLHSFTPNILVAVLWISQLFSPFTADAFASLWGK